MNIFFNVVFPALLAALALSCAPNTDTMNEELRYFPSCFSGNINSPKGYKNHIEVNFTLGKIYLRIASSQSIPSFAEQRSHCNIRKMAPEVPGSTATGLRNMWIGEPAYKQLLNEPYNPCMHSDEPMMTLLWHDWIGFDNQNDIWELTFENNHKWKLSHYYHVFLVYNIDTNETRTAWSGFNTKGWDGIIKGNLSHVLMQDQFGNNITNQAIWDNFLGELGNDNKPRPYDRAVRQGHIHAEELRAIANFSRIFHYLTTLRLYLYFYHPSQISGQPQVLVGDYSLEAKVTHNTYRTQELWYNPHNFKSTIPKAHPSYSGVSETLNVYTGTKYDQVPAIRGKTESLVRCSY